MTSMPKNVVVVLLDSLNRHMLGAYGSPEFATPNIDRFYRERAIRFTKHFTGSLPCMPARHDILVGALDFLWRPWGSIELWEEPITRALHRHDVATMLVTDHPHLFETGGENYHTDFFGWDYLRGHEGDLWRTVPDATWLGAPAMPARSGNWWMEKLLGRDNAPTLDRGYDRTRTYFRDEEDYPGPKTMAAAAKWLTVEAPRHDRFFLFVDEFDPHEPFDTPAPWYGMYEDEPWPDDAIIWPPYADGAISKGTLSEAEGRHIRANYGSKLSMIDHWFGRILDAFDTQGLWDDTALMVCTDHGHYLGDERRGRDIWGKPAVPQFEPLGHTPLLMYWPGQDGHRDIDALTTNVDIHATLLDVFGATATHATHGKSMVPLITGAKNAIREYAIGGVFGNWVQVTDGERKYARAPGDSGFPLSMWSNRWSTMPIHGMPDVVLPRPNDEAYLDRMPGSDVPVIRQPFRSDGAVPFWVNGPRNVGNHFVYDLNVDPDEQENRKGETIETELVDLLRHGLTDVSAPHEQFERLGIA